MIRLLLPIITIIFIISIPIIFVKMSKGKKRITVKVTHWLLYIYVGVLLLSMCLFLFLSNQMIEGRERVSKDQIHAEIEEFHKALREGNLEKLASQNLLKHSSFPYQQPTLKINYDSTHYSQIYVERKTIDDGMIDAYVYAHGPVIGGYVSTDRLKPLRIAVSDADSTLTILSHVERQEINVSIMKNEFPINQFSNQTKFFDIELHEEPAVYIQIPKGVELIENQDLDLIYVGENS